MEETNVNLPVNPNHRNEEIRGLPLIGEIRACSTPQVSGRVSEPFVAISAVRSEVVKCPLHQAGHSRAISRNREPLAGHAGVIEADSAFCRLSPSCSLLIVCWRLNGRLLTIHRSLIVASSHYSMKTKNLTSGAEGFHQRLDLLRNAADRGWLAQGARGIEKESLRVLPDGTLAQTSHPAALGAALTHPELTTDYSEALLEFITPPVTDPTEAIRALRTLHRFVHRNIDDEILWDLSMPGPLPQDAQIPIADYGRSNLGRFKHVYRRGLALRYGRAMQCIAGIHYNFSLPTAIWPLLAAGAGIDGATNASATASVTAPGAAQAPDDVQSAGYMSMIRNYRRFSWLLLYLFGASPALDRSFFRDREDPTATDKPHGLDTFGTDTLYLPYATSLRMSDLGYHNRASREMRRPDLSTLRTYLSGLSEAIAAPYAPYAEVGTHQEGEWVQLNTNLLQIENELYATIRPKRVGIENERIMHALARAGIEYVEVRCLDLDPFEDVGISDTTVRFLDAFLMMCVLEDSPCDTALQSEADANFLDVAKDGRRPDKSLVCNGTAIALADWAAQLLTRIETTAQLLDSQRGDGVHLAAVHAQRAKLAAPALLPSSRVWAATQAAGSYAAFGLARSRLHAEIFRSEPLPPADSERLNAMATASFATQQEREASDTMDFDTFVAQYGPLQ